MFITQGTVFSQIFWLAICVSLLMFVTKKVFIKRIKQILIERHEKIAQLNQNINALIQESGQISEQTKQIELGVYEKINLENAKIAADMKIELDKNIEDMKSGFINEKAKLEKNLKKFKMELLQEVDAKMPTLTKKAMKKIKQ